MANLLGQLDSTLEEILRCSMLLYAFVRNAYNTYGIEGELGEGSSIFLNVHGTLHEDGSEQVPTVGLQPRTCSSLLPPLCSLVLGSSPAVLAPQAGTDCIHSRLPSDEHIRASALSAVCLPPLSPGPLSPDCLSPLTPRSIISISDSLPLSQGWSTLTKDKKDEGDQIAGLYVQGKWDDKAKKYISKSESLIYTLECVDVPDAHVSLSSTGQGSNLSSPPHLSPPLPSPPLLASPLRSPSSLHSCVRWFEHPAVKSQRRRAPRAVRVGQERVGASIPTLRSRQGK